MAVESIDRIGEGLDGIVVAQVLDLRPHPNADKIQLVDVDPGDGEALQICCGAFNMAVGDLVPAGHPRHRRCPAAWRSPGASCAASGPTACCAPAASSASATTTPASWSSPGDLAARAPPIAEALGIDPDVLYDLEINPNRPDAMSVAGVARDLAARLGAAVRHPRRRRSTTSPATPPAGMLGRDRRPRPVRPLPRPGPRRRHGRAVARAGSPTASRRSACARSTTWSTSPTT